MKQMKNLNIKNIDYVVTNTGNKFNQLKSFPSIRRNYFSVTPYIHILGMEMSWILLNKEN